MGLILSSLAHTKRLQERKFPSPSHINAKFWFFCVTYLLRHAHCHLDISGTKLINWYFVLFVLVERILLASMRATKLSPFQGCTEWSMASMFSIQSSTSSLLGQIRAFISNTRRRKRGSHLYMIQSRSCCMIQSRTTNTCEFFSLLLDFLQLEWV